MKKILAILLALIMVLGMSAAFAETTGRIGVAMPTKSSERWIRDGNSVKEGLEAQGYEVDLQYAEDNIDYQISQIENMLVQGVDALGHRLHRRLGADQRAQQREGAGRCDHRL